MTNDTVLRRLHALFPYESLEPQPMAVIDLAPAVPVKSSAATLLRAAGATGLRGPAVDPLELFEPARAIDEPVLLPTRALRIVLTALGVDSEYANGLARDSRPLIDAHVPPSRQHPFFTSDGVALPQPMITVGDWLEWLPHVRRASAAVDEVLRRGDDMLAFIASCADRIADIPLFDPIDPPPDDWEEEDGLEEDNAEKRLVCLAWRPGVPTPLRMAQYMEPSDPAERPHDWPVWTRPVLTHDAWHERHQRALQALTDRLGQPVFLTWLMLDDEEEQDVEGGGMESHVAHRWVALHCHCAMFPDSPLAQRLRQVIGAPTTEVLLDRLLDPALYADPFDVRATAAQLLHGSGLDYVAFEYRP